ncbi:MAG: efflux RND transporter periplasmic adaptor subunit [Chlorobi bacterium]|nr:efflux RND transporter periplasmic adaptor subunit [Chlorobiota bacterium]
MYHWRAAVGLCCLLLGCTSKEHYYRVHPTDLVEAVYASGVLRTADEYRVFSPVQGVLTRLYVSVGDSVERGTLLFEVKSDEPLVRLRSAEEFLNYAQQMADTLTSPQLAELRAQRESARVRYELDSSYFDRIRIAYTAGAIAVADYDRARATMTSSRTAYFAARERYAAAIASSRNQLQQAMRQYELARTSLDNFRVTAVVSGRVLARYRSVGEMLTTQAAILAIGRSDERYLDLYCDVADAYRLREGQTVLYTLEAYPDSIFTARVTTIYPAIDATTQSIHVEARCHSAPPRLVTDIPIQANIIIAQRPNALAIPRRAVHPDTTVVLRSGERRKVRLGIRSLEYVEVTDGLGNGDEVVLP